MLNQALGAWVAPLLLIPGMALLTIPTANRYNQLLLFVAQHGRTPSSEEHLSYLRRALVSLYCGIGVDAVAGLGGGILAFSPNIAHGVIVGFSCVGVALLVVATGFLTAEVWRTPALPTLTEDL